MADRPPGMAGYGYITKVLNKIKTAALPPRFTQDFLATKLALKGGSPKPVIPYLKRTGFLGGDGVPTELYKRFRNPSESGRAAAEALRHGYFSLYEMNEYLHDASDKDIKGLIVQATGLEPTSGTIANILGSFKALRTFASFDDATDLGKEEVADVSEATPAPAISVSAKRRSEIGLSYTINLNLPATSDIAVFDAIFKSVREHLLQ